MVIYVKKFFIVLIPFITVFSFGGVMEEIDRIEIPTPSGEEIERSLKSGVMIIEPGKRESIIS